MLFERFCEVLNLNLMINPLDFSSDTWYCYASGQEFWLLAQAKCSDTAYLTPKEYSGVVQMSDWPYSVAEIATSGGLKMLKFSYAVRIITLVSLIIVSISIKAPRVYESNNFNFVFAHSEGALEDRFTVSAGHAHSCAIRNGALFCWGRNDEGQLGDNSTITRTVPTQVLTMTSGVTVVSGGEGHTCAIKRGALFCWGRNSLGHLGDGTTTQRTQPVAVKNMGSGVTNVAAGRSHTCAIKHGALWCWGYNNNGRLGDGTTMMRTEPVSVMNMGAGVTAVATASAHSCAIKDGALYCWGGNNDGQLGDGTTTQHITPTLVTDMESGVSFVAAGGSHTCAIKDGALYCWGWNAYGQLGDNSTVSRTTPVPVVGMGSGVTFVTAGTFHTCAVKNGAAFCWGLNSGGQLGNNSLAQQNAPIPVSSPMNNQVIVISAGGNHTMGGTRANQCLYGWGLNDRGQIGDGSTTNRLTPTSVNPGCLWDLERRAFIPMVFYGP